MIVQTAHDILRMREAGRIAALALQTARGMTRAGMSTLRLDQIINDVIRLEGAEAAFVGYQGYKHSSCISLNDEVIHSPPQADKIIQPGDLVSLDTGAIVDGFYSDCAISFVVPPMGGSQLALVDVTHNALAGILRYLRPGPVAQVANTLNQYLPASFNAVPNYTGHGIGRNLHEPPVIPNVLTDYDSTGEIIEAGSIIAIEPIVVLGVPHTVVDSDGWTVRTADGSLAAHFEVTVWVTEQGSHVLTPGLIDSDTH